VPWRPRCHALRQDPDRGQLKGRLDHVVGGIRAIEDLGKIYIIVRLNLHCEVDTRTYTIGLNLTPLWVQRLPRGHCRWAISAFCRAMFKRCCSCSPITPAYSQIKSVRMPKSSIILGEVSQSWTLPRLRRRLQRCRRSKERICWAAVQFYNKQKLRQLMLKKRLAKCRRILVDRSTRLLCMNLQAEAGKFRTLMEIETKETKRPTIKCPFLPVSKIMSLKECKYYHFRIDGLVHWPPHQPPLAERGGSTTFDPSTRFACR
jgi:hypothetical protein